MDVEPVAGGKAFGELRNGMRPQNLTQNKTPVLFWKGRRKERIWSFRGAYANRGNRMERVSSDVMRP